MGRLLHSSGLRSLVVALTGVAVSVPVDAGHFGFRNNSIGGVSIDVEGVVGPPSDDAKKLLLAAMRKELKPAPAGLVAPIAMRMISLKQLEAACATALRENFGKVPDEVRYLGGLQRIQYVFAYPEYNDVVLAGPGEGWKLDANAHVVGVTTSRPVLQLDDLLIAFRSVEAARRGGISVSIEPTEAGNRALQQVLEQQRQQPRVNPPVLEAAIKQAFGPQQVILRGVQQNSHFARTLVAADYRMKRLAMNLDKSPVNGLPSYQEMMKTAGPGVGNTTPRWWLACHYQPLAASEDKLAWELRGPGVKALSEDDFIAPDGTRAASGRSSPLARKWADLLTTKYDELAGRDPAFGELRNLMDLAVIAALIEKEGLLEKAGCPLPLVTGADSDLKVQTWNAPRSVHPEVSFVRARETWIVSASGGVQVESWDVASRQETIPALAETRTKATPTGNSLIWQQ